MKKFLFILSISILFSREVFLNTHDAFSVKSSQTPLNIIDNENNLVERTTRADIILFHWDFEEDLWNNDGGWELTEISYNSETHSYNSPNTPDTYNSIWNLTSDIVTLPALGDGEIMRFKFWLWGDTPDTDGDGDGYLEDYYQLSIMDLEALAWHASANAPEADGNAYWCADEDIGPDGGYLDEWMQYLDTPPITLTPSEIEYMQFGATLKWRIEDPAGAVVAGTCTDGWDAANVRISADGGTTWDLLSDPNLPYDFDCGYGWIYNDSEYDTGGSLNQVAAGWGGNSDGFVNFSADLTQWIGQEVIIRFAFGSDPAYNTFDQTDMTGFQVDDIFIDDGMTYHLFEDNVDDTENNNMMIPSGEVWESIFYDYCDSTRPGGNGWEEYVPGLAFNGNVLHDISHLAGKDVIVKFSSRYDDNDDGGAGQGLFIDDFIIYKEAGLEGPGGLTAESGDTEAHLTWQDMNASGDNEDFAFDNDNFGDNLISMVDADAVGYAGTSFNFAGTSTVHTVDFFHTSGQTDFRMSICPYGSVGSLFDTATAYDCVDVETSTLTDGWNTIDVPEWEMSGNFIIAHSFNSTYGAVLDGTADGSHSYFSYQQSNGNTSNWQSELSSDGSFEGEWGIRANISYQGADVTYNIYRDGISTTTGINTYMYTDTDLINNVEYTYQVSATYSDGVESDLSDSVVVTPQAQTIHQESWDDGTAESNWNPDGSGQYGLVKFTAHDMGEQIIRFHWFQEGQGGAFYVKVWDDEGGLPGEEILSLVQVAGNADGWNVRDLISENLDVTCDFWIGVKRFSSSMPIGLDTSSSSGNSYTSDNGSTWNMVNGNLMFMVDLDAGEDGGNSCDGEDVTGDMNGDGSINILDVLILINFIFDDIWSEVGDINGDGNLNISDCILLVNIILNG